MKTAVTATSSQITFKRKNLNNYIMSLELEMSEEPTMTLSTETCNQVSKNLYGSYKALLVDIRGALFLEVEKQIFFDEVYCKKMRQIPAGIAILSDSRIMKQQLITALAFVRSTIPVRFFTEEEHAIAWLNGRVNASVQLS